MDTISVRVRNKIELSSVEKLKEYTMVFRRVSGFVFSLFMIIVFCISCSNPSSPNPEGTANLSIQTSLPSGGGITMSINPSQEKIVPDKLVIELKQNDETKFKGEFDYKNSDESYTLNNVTIGTYDIVVTGKIKAKDDGTKEIMSGQSTCTVTANGVNSCTVALKFSSDGTGAIEVGITWKDLNSSNSPISDALDNGSIGFLAYYSKNDQPISGELTDETMLDSLIKWADGDDMKACSFIYYDDDVPATGKNAEDIYFIIYTKDRNGNITAVAKTFYTTLTVYSNILSIPDSNEVYNFVLNGSNVDGYLSNVTNVQAEPAETDPQHAITVTWKNPDFSNDVYPMTVNVRIEEENGSYTSTQSKKFSSATEAKEGGSLTFDKLSMQSTYSFYFEIRGAYGYSRDELKLSGQRTRGVTAIAFKTIFKDSYEMGDKVSIDATITPDVADQDAFTIKADNGTNNVVIDDSAHTITFNSYGDYSIYLVANENTEVTSEKKTVTVRLAAPANVTATKANDGIDLSWSTVSGATTYSIYRSDKPATVLDTVSVTTYKDTKIGSGATYSYTVKAATDDPKFNSDESSSSNKVTTEPADFVITIPTIPEEDFSSALAGISENYIIIGDKDSGSFTVGLQNEVNGATHYEWQLNGTTVKSGDSIEDVSTVEIGESTPGLKKNSDDTINSLKLKITTANAVYSGTATFHVLKDTPKSIVSISDISNDKKISYNNPEQLVVNFSGEGIEPIINWTSSDEAIAEVSDNGVVTVHKMGDVKITATANVTGESSSIDIRGYIPAKEIKIVNLPHTEMLLSGNGIEIVDGSYQEMNLMDYLVVTAANGENVTSDKFGIYSSDISWSSDNTDAISINNHTGVVKVGSTADKDVLIKVVSSDNSEVYEEVTMQALKLDIILNGSVVTGGEGSVASITLIWNDPSTLSLRFSDNYIIESTYKDSNFKNDWCLDGEIGKVSGSLAFEITNSGFTGIAKRWSDAYEYTVTAVIQNKAASSRIAVLSFTAIN